MLLVIMTLLSAAAAAAARRFEDLARRFETPDPRNRWDAPLFTVTPGGCLGVGFGCKVVGAGFRWFQGRPKP
jgi:hypothetical protein